MRPRKEALLPIRLLHQQHIWSIMFIEFHRQSCSQKFPSGVVQGKDQYLFKITSTQSSALTDFISVQVECRKPITIENFDQSFSSRLYISFNRCQFQSRYQEEYDVFQVSVMAVVETVAPVTQKDPLFYIYSLWFYSPNQSRSAGPLSASECRPAVVPRNTCKPRI